MTEIVDLREPPDGAWIEAARAVLSALRAPCPPLHLGDAALRLDRLDHVIITDEASVTDRPSGGDLLGMYLPDFRVLRLRGGATERAWALGGGSAVVVFIDAMSEHVKALSEGLHPPPPFDALPLCFRSTLLHEIGHHVFHDLASQPLLAEALTDLFSAAATPEHDRSWLLASSELQPLAYSGWRALWNALPHDELGAPVLPPEALRAWGQGRLGEHLLALDARVDGSLFDLRVQHAWKALTTGSPSRPPRGPGCPRGARGPIHAAAAWAVLHRSSLLGDPSPIARARHLLWTMTDRTMTDRKGVDPGELTSALQLLEASALIDWGRLPLSLLDVPPERWLSPRPGDDVRLMMERLFLKLEPGEPARALIWLACLVREVVGRGHDRDLVTERLTQIGNRNFVNGTPAYIVPELAKFCVEIEARQS